MRAERDSEGITTSWFKARKGETKSLVQDEGFSQADRTKKKGKEQGGEMPEQEGAEERAGWD